MRRLIIIIGLSLLIGNTVNGQNKHELSVNGFGGLQTLSYSVDGATLSNGFGGGGGVGYAYNFNTSWSLLSGIDMSYYGAELRMNKASLSAQQAAGRFDYTLSGFTEKQSLLMLEIPLLGRYTLPLADKHAFQFAGGCKIGIPVSTNYTAQAAGHQTNAVYLDYEAVEYNIDALFAPNTPKGVKEYSGSYEANIAVQLHLEAGYRLSLTERMSFYAGLYFNYGLNNMQKKSDAALVTFAEDNSTLTSSPPKYTYSSGALDTGLVSAFRPMAVGLNLRLTFGL